jgi:uncharacterized protein GlcG (DUF336 family)
MAALLVCACSGGGGGSSPQAAPTTLPSSDPPRVYVAPAQRALSAADAGQIIAQAVNEAEARAAPGVVAVVDRVGNVLGVFAMTGASATQRTRLGPAATAAGPGNGNFDAQGLDVPRAMAAISKAVTGAYLSSSGNAFSTRTASQIVQERFPPSPSTLGLEGGPLFGVQFSQLPCSDLSQRYRAGPEVGAGPHRAPLGLAADPGGFPLYKDGVVVGGIGFSGDADYGFDTNILDIDLDIEEFVALAGTIGFDAPTTIRAERISVDGTTLRYADATSGGLLRNPATAPAFATLSPTRGALMRVTGYFGAGSPALQAGAAYGTEASGVRASTSAEFRYRDAFVVSDGAGANRFPIRAGTDGGLITQPLTEPEARAILEEAFGVMSAARAQIRQPLDSRAEVTISLVDTTGAVLGIVRSPDAPIFGIDVSLQKARSAAFLTAAIAGSDLLGAVRNPALASGPDANVTAFVGATRTFLSMPSALTGGTAFSARAIGNLARPYYPDGQVGNANGPLSRPIAQWSPFSTGLQSALIVDNVFQHAVFVSGGAVPDTRQRCTFLPDTSIGGPTRNRLQNGLQIFPGGVPVFRGGVLVGGLGVSGDGIDQDDMISFLGLHRAGVRVGGVGNAPAAIRSDQMGVTQNGQFVRLRYVNCPFQPFLTSGDQNVCQGL